MRDNLVDYMNSLLSDAAAHHSEQQAVVDNYRESYYNRGEWALKPSSARTNNTASIALVKDVMRTVEGSIPSLVAPFLEKDIAVLESSADNEEMKELVKTHERLVNYQWNKKANPLETIETIARNVQVDGTTWTRVGWNAKGYPTVDVVPFESVIPDPSAYKQEDMKFVIYRRKVTVSDILTNREWFGEHTLDSLRPLSAPKGNQYEPDERTGRDDSFDMGQRASETLEIFEFYGEYDADETGITKPMVIIWSENMMLNMFDSPYNGFSIPFDCGIYTRRPYSIYGSSVAELIGEHQRTRQSILRGVLDNMNSADNGTKFVKKGAFDDENFKRYQNHEKIVEVNHNSQEPLGNAFWDGGYNQIPPEVYKLMESYEIEEENLTGITKYAVGTDSRSLNQTATGVSIISSMSQRRLLFITQHIAGLLTRVFQKWILLNDEFIVGSGMAEQMDLYVRAGTAGLQAKKVQDISNMLSALAPYTGAIDPAIITDLVADLAEEMDLNTTSKRIRTSADEKRKQAASPEAQQQQAQEQEIVKQTALRAESAKIAKDESIADWNNAKAVEAQVDAATKMYAQPKDQSESRRA